MRARVCVCKRERQEWAAFNVRSNIICKVTVRAYFVCECEFVRLHLMEYLSMFIMYSKAEDRGLR